MREQVGYHCGQLGLCQLGTIRKPMEHPSESILQAWGGLPAGVTPSPYHCDHHPGWLFEMLVEGALDRRKYPPSLKWKVVNMPAPALQLQGDRCEAGVRQAISSACYHDTWAQRNTATIYKGTLRK